jgi:hypothetical protein
LFWELGENELDHLARSSADIHLRANEYVLHEGEMRGVLFVLIVATNAALDACLAGYMGAALVTVSSLLRRAVDSAWSATASRLGADLVGLYGASGECGSAVRWYARLWPVWLKSARPRVRWSVTVEAAGSYAAASRPCEALAILNQAKDAASCPPRAVREKHAFVASSLLQLGENAKALREAHAALRGARPVELGAA